MSWQLSVLELLRNFANSSGKIKWKRIGKTELKKPKTENREPITDKAG